MTYRQRLSLFVLVDTIIVLSAIFISSFLVNATIYVVTVPVFLSSLAILLSHHFFAVRYKLYRKVWSYASIGELAIIFKTVTFAIVIAGVVQFWQMGEVYYRLLTVTWLLHILFIGGSRFVWRMYIDSLQRQSKNKIKTLIIGAGAAGTMVARQLLKNKEGDLVPVAFIDDDVKKQQLDILGVPVVGGSLNIETVVKEMEIEQIVIAIPSLNKRELNTIFLECAKTEAETKILPMLEDLVTGKVSINQARDVQVEDLLGREQVVVDMESITETVTGKTILITGAGGSIGSEISRQIASFKPDKMILLGHGENSIYTIEMELKETYKQSGIEFITEIADIQDEEKMLAVMKLHQPDVVYHAAAHKHVPLMERNPEEAVKNNVIGTINTARAAAECTVGTFVMVSSDKAVNPTSVMGSTKKIAEMIVQGMDKTSSTNFTVVRFGNVLGSRGSVIPLFKKQIERGGPVTVTHPDMIRYFMTIPEASRLVIQAGALADGGEIFVLDMGAPVKIVDLAKNLIKLSGNSVQEIGLEFTGMRPGEKLYEELLQEDEIKDQQIHPKIHIGKSVDLHLDEIEEILSTFTNMDKETLRVKLLNLANRSSLHNTNRKMSV